MRPTALFTYHVDHTLPAPGSSILVFGSNVSGKHGRGAARVAWKVFGARYGVGQGQTGHAYAIPTKDAHFVTLPIEAIKESVEAFLRHARENPTANYWVTRIACGLAGCRDEQIAPLFRGAPSNCSFAEDWKPFLEHQS